MTVQIANALGGYFETLYVLNQNLITLCGLDVIDNSGQYEKLVQDVIQAIPRLIPYRRDNGVLRIDERDGLLEYSDQIEFLKADYEGILQLNYGFLLKAKDVRNKFEHKMHGVRLIAGGSVGGAVSFDMTYAIGDQQITITSGELITLAKSLNTLFAKLQVLVDQFAYEQGKSDHPYYRRLLRYTFTDFNKVYESSVLSIIGKAMFPF